MLSSPALAAVSGSVVLATADNERNPAAGWNNPATQGVEYLAYAQNTAAAPNHYDAYFWDSQSGNRVKLNLRGQGWAGGIDGPGGRVVYQRVLNGQSDIELYTVGSGREPFAHSPNTSRWEWHPTISGNELLFNRDDVSSPTERVYLEDLSTGAQQRLDMTTASSSALYAGQVNGTWAVWTKCNPTCKVYRFDATQPLGSTNPVRLAVPSGTTPQQYGAAVTSQGVVYLARSGTSCGSNVRIVRYFGTGDPATGQVIWTLAAGRDLTFGFARENGLDGTVDYFYDRIMCSTARWDIYKITDGP